MRRTFCLLLFATGVAMAAAGCSKTEGGGAPGPGAGGPPGGEMSLPIEAVTVRAEPLSAGLQ
ncbi:MAG: hypothetical protein LC715_04895, partial [Gammaproteobacteria bacterium]|nr:hypothetical protein [Gammaproteobacteria bacterium]